MKQSSQWPSPSAPFSPIAANGRPKDAAGHGTPLVDVATTGGGVESGTCSVVGKVFKEGLVGFCRAEHASVGIAGKTWAELGKPGAGAKLDFRG